MRLAWFASVAFGLLTLACLACGDAATTPAPTPTPGTVKRGPEALAIDGDPNGLFWDDGQQTLYIADDNGNRILRWTDAAGFGLVKDLPTASAQGAGLGQLVRTPTGELVVTRFGGGTAGDVAYVAADGTAKVVPNIDPTRRRIGLTVTADGRLFDGWFVRTSSGARAGSVGLLALGGTETEVLAGLKKPIGVLAAGDSLFVSDQDLGQILKAPLADPSRFTVFATVAAPDLLAAGPNGSLFTGSEGGNLFAISATGTASVFKSGFRAVRGVAYDPSHKRVFVADHDATASLLHILPVDE